MPVIDTAELEVLDKRPGWRGRLIHSANMTFAHWEFDAGADIHEHDHLQEEVWHVLEGRLEMTIGEERCEVGAGMVAIVPADVRHSVRALAAGKAIVADFPLRTDFG
ncbi:MAG: cupin domain-containing protein [Caulobacteraceae bacterium]